MSDQANQAEWINLGLMIVSLLLAGYSLNRPWDQHVEATPRLSGNCGPAAQGLTPVGDVVPIKVDFAGHVLVAQSPAK